MITFVSEIKDGELIILLLNYIILKEELLKIVKISIILRYTYY